MNARSIAFAQQANYGGCSEQVVQERQQQVADAIARKQGQDPQAAMVLRQQADQITAWYGSTNTAERFSACAKYDAIIKAAQM